MWGTPQGMVYLATGHHDMRKSINGLALVVADTLGLDPHLEGITSNRPSARTAMEIFQTEVSPISPSDGGLRSLAHRLAS